MAELSSPYSRVVYADAAEQERGLDGWSQSYCQLSPGAYRGVLETLALGPVTVHRERINLPVEQRTAPPSGQVVYACSLGGRGPWRLNAVALGGDTLAILRRSEEQTAAFGSHSDLLFIAAAETALGETEPGAASPSTVPAGEAFGFLSSWLMSLLSHFATLEAGVGGDLAAVLPGMVLDRLQFVHGLVSAHGSRSRRVEPDARLFRTARDIAEASEADDLTVADLAARAGVSPGVLREAFMRTVGVGPGTWLRSRRLDGARRDLLAAARTGATVTDIAAKWGFLHFGRFAATYAAYYGEPPSRTARGGRDH
ncbi:helix-turn-helix domain-containing protein [Mongoliimonas terrestris]|uniref:helix-turn-helix domain-containing protein n=1 Tax=Mongoliimonas terrestris TaxID=1709001 RepID=UPI000949900A|nr:helix-turn-helix domain-containing protein [Mongoliimonas terrestris]